MSFDKEIIKIQAKHGFTLFPKQNVVLGKGENIFGIVKWNIVDVLEGNPTADGLDNVIITGKYEEEIDTSETYTILAKEVEHPQYGKQYELMFIGKLLDLNNTNNQKAFLKTFLTEGQISEMFRVLRDPLKTIQEHDIPALKKVKGVGDYISKRIIERFEAGKDYCSVYLELDDMGLTPKFIQKLVSQYRNPDKVIQIVKNNPYQLSFDIEGIGFRTADKIALSNGMNPKSESRIEGYIHYLLSDLGEMGNSYIPAGELTAYIFNEFGGKDEILEVFYDDEGKAIGTNIKKAISNMEEKGIITVEETEIKSKRKVYLTKYYKLEKEIAYHLKRIASADNGFVFNNWLKVVKEQEQIQGWEFTQEQIDGIKTCLENQVCLITGGAGTGKTSVLSGALQALRCYEGKYSFAQCSLAGKAAARMQEVTGEEGSTIHRLLGYKPPGRFTCNEECPLFHDIIIVDEISLIGGEIFLSLIKAIKAGSKLIVLGDLGQLESIGSLNLASDLYNSNYVKTVELTKIHRQAQKSGIIIASKKIRDGEQLFNKSYEGDLTLGELQDMHFSISSSKAEIRNKAIETYKRYWNSNLVSGTMDIQILAPVKERGDASVFNLNLDIQEFINPPSPDKEEIKINYGKDKFFNLREGDKVMNVKNNYELSNSNWKDVEVFNGWTGTVEEIDTIRSEVTIYFPIIQDSVIFPFSILQKHIILGYASTVHKYQGSSSKVIIGVLDYSTPPDMRTKELLYTMITRAEEECAIIGQNVAIHNAINTSGVADKNTFLVELLDDENETKLIIKIT